jgi:hypothetical protein
MRRIVRLSALLLIAALAGCTSPYHEEKRDGGVTPTVAEGLLLGIEGVSAANYETVSWYSPGEGGAFSASGMAIVFSVTVDPEHSVADPEGWLRFLAATAWSVNDHLPRGDVVIALTGGKDVFFDWTAVASEVLDVDERSIDATFLQHEVEDAISVGAVPIVVDASAYGAVFGRWPSEPVSVPAGLLANEPPAKTTRQPITDLVLTEWSSDGDPPLPDCLGLTYMRQESGLGRYDGEVVVTVHSEDGTPGKVDTGDGDARRADFCYAEGRRPANAYVTVEAQPAGGFEEFTTTVRLTER